MCPHSSLRSLYLGLLLLVLAEMISRPETNIRINYVISHGNRDKHSTRSPSWQTNKYRFIMHQFQGRDKINKEWSWRTGRDVSGICWNDKNWKYVPQCAFGQWTNNISWFMKFYWFIFLITRTFLIASDLARVTGIKISTPARWLRST